MSKRREKKAKAYDPTCKLCGIDSFTAGAANCRKWNAKSEERGDCGFWLRIEARRQAQERRAEWEKANPEEVAIRDTMRQYRSMDREAARKHVQWRKRQREFDAMPMCDQIHCARYVLAVCPWTAKAVMGGTRTLADAYDEITAMPVHKQLLLSLLAKHDPEATGSPEARAHVEAAWAAIAEGTAPMSTIPLFALCEALVTNASVAA